MPATLGGSVLRYVEVRRHTGEIQESTATGARWVLWHFASVVDLDLPPGKLTRRHVERWAASRTVAPATMRTELSLLRTYTAWLVREGVLKKDPALGIRGPRRPRDVPRALGVASVGEVLAHCPDLRAKLIVSLMVQEGLRCVEVASLQRSDVDLVVDTLLVVGKGGHERLLPITDETRHMLSRYLREFPAPAGPLIRSYQAAHRGLSPATLSQYVGGWFGDAGVKASAHALRHTMASDMLDRGANIREVQIALGHVSLATTQRYLRRQDGKNLRGAMSGRSYTSTAGQVVGGSTRSTRWGVERSERPAVRSEGASGHGECAPASRLPSRPDPTP